MASPTRLEFHFRRGPSCVGGLEGMGDDAMAGGSGSLFGVPVWGVLSLGGATVPPDLCLESEERPRD